jgi:hypothetical protein
VIVIILLVVTFLGGAIVGIMALLRLGIAQDERSESLSNVSPTRVSAATRRTLGFYSRGLERRSNTSDRKSAEDSSMFFQRYPMTSNHSFSKPGSISTGGISELSLNLSAFWRYR